MPDSDPSIRNDHELAANEQRTFGGFLHYDGFTPETPRLIQFEVPAGLERVATAYDQSIDRVTTLDTVLTDGFPDARTISRQFGFSRHASTGRLDVVAITDQHTHLLELKTEEEGVESLTDCYRPFGQAVFARDRIAEDYPDVVAERPVLTSVVAEDLDVDPALVRQTFDRAGVGLFDVSAGEFVIEPHVDDRDALSRRFE